MAGDEITLVIKGQSPTLLHAGKANELIQAINALQNISISRGDRDQVIYSSDSIEITLAGGGGGSAFTGELPEVVLHNGETWTLSFQNGICSSAELIP
jgi:hypothetical protein